MVFSELKHDYVFRCGYMNAKSALHQRLDLGMLLEKAHPKLIHDRLKDGVRAVVTLGWELKLDISLDDQEWQTEEMWRTTLTRQSRR